MTELKKYIPQRKPRWSKARSFVTRKNANSFSTVPSSEWRLLVAVDGCDDHRLVDRVVAGEEEGVFAGAQGTPGRIDQYMPLGSRVQDQLT